jgi:hypothetical protein
MPKPIAVTATALATESPNRPSDPAVAVSSARARALLIGLGVVIAASGALALRYAPPPSRPVASVTKTEPQPPTAAKEAELYRVTIATVPSGASVLFDGAELGKTPYLFEFKRKSELQLVKRGYRREVVQVSADSDPNVVVDLARDKSLPEVEPPKPVATAERTRSVPELAANSGNRIEPLPPEPAPPVDQPALIVPDAPQAAAPTETSQSAAIDPHEQRATYDGLGSRPDDDPEQPRRHRLRAAAHAIGRFMGRLLGGGGTPNERLRRQELLQQELPYATFADAERAYNHREIDRDRYEDVLWALRERRRQRIEAEKFNLARGLITPSEYESRLDSIGAEFRGQ